MYHRTFMEILERLNLGQIQELILHKLNGYINDKTLTYERLASNSNIPKLPIASKLNLIDFFESSDFMRGIGAKKYFCESVQSGMKKPLFHEFHNVL